MAEFFLLVMVALPKVSYFQKPYFGKIKRRSRHQLAFSWYLFYTVWSRYMICRYLCTITKVTQKLLRFFCNFQDASFSPFLQQQFSLDIRHRFKRVQLLRKFEICLIAGITERILIILESLLIMLFLFNFHYFR